MVEEMIFSKIICWEILLDIVYQDEFVIVFCDIFLQVFIYILIVLNVLIFIVNDVIVEYELVLGWMMIVVVKIVCDEGFVDDGYWLIVNCNCYGGQEVYYIYMYLLGGCLFGLMLVYKG